MKRYVNDIFICVYWHLDIDLAELTPQRARKVKKKKHRKGEKPHLLLSRQMANGARFIIYCLCASVVGLSGIFQSAPACSPHSERVSFALLCIYDFIDLSHSTAESQTIKTFHLLLLWLAFVPIYLLLAMAKKCRYTIITQSQNSIDENIGPDFIILPRIFSFIEMLRSVAVVNTRAQFGV